MRTNAVANDADDAAEGRDREQPSSRAAQRVHRLRRDAHGDRRDRCEHDAHRPEKQDGGDERVQAHAGVHSITQRRMRSSANGIASTSSAPSAITQSRRRTDGQRSASAPPTR